MRRFTGFSALISLACVASAASRPSSTPQPGWVLDRYLQATGGASAWRSKKSARAEIEGRTLDRDRLVLRATTLTARGGNALSDIAVPEEAREGVYNGVAWAWTRLSGPRIKRGADRDLALAGARMLEEADWRSLYPQSRVEGTEQIGGRTCYKLVLLPSADNRVEWFDAETGLLARRLASDSVYTVETWRVQDGLKQPASLLVESGDLRYRLSILRVAYNVANHADAFRYPEPVETYLREDRAGRALPNAEELIERHIFASGGSPAYEALKTQRITGTLAFLTRNIEARTETWSAAGGRYYQLTDIPGFGKQEEGSDGHFSWERSPILGPRTRPRKSLTDLGVTLDAAEVVGWRYLVGEVRTEALENIDGRACYRVRVVGRDGSLTLRWYDRRTGLLYRASMPFKTEMGVLPAVMTYQAYRDVAGLKWPVEIHMAVSGQELLFKADEVALNDPIDDSVFTLPEEIRQIAGRDR